ncbi:MAG: ABC transporter permease [bacterium]|nr:ABC transporter permease [bacterium]
MRTGLHQWLALTRAYVVAWLLTPRHACISLAAAVGYLAVINQSFVVALTPRVRVGVHTKDANIGQHIRDELMGKGLAVIAYATPAEALHALSNGLLMAVVDVAPRMECVTVSFAGRNPLMDRELVNVLFQMTANLAEKVRTRYRLNIQGISYTPHAVRAFVTANLVSFLLLSLIIINGGIVQVLAVEGQTLFTQLLTPVSRAVLLAARLSSGILVSLAVFLLAYALCVPVVGLPLPARPLAWLAVCLLQLLSTGAVYVYLALIIRRYIPFAQISVISVTLLTFASGAVTPFEVMPQWERVFATCTPALYMIRSMRAVMLATEPLRLNDLVVLAMWGLAGSMLAYLRLRRMTLV